MATTQEEAEGKEKEAGSLDGLGGKLAAPDGRTIPSPKAFPHLRNTRTLAPGHVVTIEPGVYLPGIGGVRIEDDYLITNTGARNLCSLPKTRRWSTL